MPSVSKGRGIGRHQAQLQNPRPRRHDQHHVKNFPVPMLGACHGHGAGSGGAGAASLGAAVVVIVVEEVGWPFACRPAPGFGGTRPEKTCPVLLSVSGCVQEVVRGCKGCASGSSFALSSELLAYFWLEDEWAGQLYACAVQYKAREAKGRD